MAYLIRVSSLITYDRFIVLLLYYHRSSDLDHIGFTVWSSQSPRGVFLSRHHQMKFNAKDMLSSAISP